MIVGVDARHLRGDRGVAHHTAALLRSLAERFPADEWRLFVPGDGALALAALPNVRVATTRVPSRVLFGAAAVAGRPRLDALVGGADVVLLPAPAPVAVSPGVPAVLTVHDLSWLERPGDFTPYERLWHRLGRFERLARRSAAVTAQSEATRAAVAERWGIDARVVHPGVPEPADGAPPPGLPERFFLFVGALEPRKAPDMLVRAHALARARGLRADLVVAGAGRLAPALHGDGVHVVGRVDALGPLYRRALALVLPSRLEGFGFPPLEAARAGTPSIVSDLPVFRETLGDAALFVRGAEEAWAQALLAAERGDVPGPPGTSRFSWARAADELHAVLAEVAR